MVLLLLLKLLYFTQYIYGIILIKQQILWRQNCKQSI